MQNKLIFRLLSTTWALQITSFELKILVAKFELEGSERSHPHTVKYSEIPYSEIFQITSFELKILFAKFELEGSERSHPHTVKFSTIYQLNN